MEAHITITEQNCSFDTLNVNITFVLHRGGQNKEEEEEEEEESIREREIDNTEVDIHVYVCLLHNAIIEFTDFSETEKPL